MATITFDILDWLSGITPYIFDRAVLQNVALEVGVSGITSFEDLTQYQKDHCEIALLKKVYFGPNTMAGSTHTHGAFTETIGPQQVTADVRERIFSRIKALEALYDEDTIGDNGTVDWVNEDTQQCIGI